MLSADNARGAFESLSGEVHASAKSTLVTTSHLVRDAAFARIGESMDQPGPMRVASLNYDYQDEQHLAASPGLILWGQGIGNWSNLEQGRNAAALRTSTGGLLMGADQAVGSQARIGLLAGYSRDDFNVRQRGSTGESENILLGVYGGARWDALSLRAGLSYTWHDIATDRIVTFPNFSDRLRANYKGGTFQAFGELAWRLNAGAFAIEPFLNAAHVRLRTDGFTERSQEIGTGGAAALLAPKQTTKTTFASLGMRTSAAFDLGGLPARALGAVAWRHAMGDTTPRATLVLADTSGSFLVSGAPLADDVATIRAGLDIQASERISIAVSYNGEFGSGTTSHGVSGNLRFRF